MSKLGASAALRGAAECWQELNGIVNCKASKAPVSIWLVWLGTSSAEATLQLPESQSRPFSEEGAKRVSHCGRQELASPVGELMVHHQLWPFTPNLGKVW